MNSAYVDIAWIYFRCLGDNESDIQYGLDTMILQINKLLYLTNNHCVRVKKIISKFRYTI